MAITIAGQKFRELRQGLVLTQAELARKLELSEARIRKIEGSQKTGVYPKTLRNLATLTGKTAQQLQQTLAPDPDETSDLDPNVMPYSEVPVPEIPTFDLPIAAGPWMELPEVEEMRSLATQRDGRFRVHIRGDSMQGQEGYPDGSIVEFRCLRPEIGDGRGSKMELGKDYYVQKSECATFKQLESFDDEYIYLRARNRKKYPEKIKVLRSDVVRMARAECIILMR